MKRNLRNRKQGATSIEDFRKIWNSEAKKLPATTVQNLMKRVKFKIHPYAKRVNIIFFKSFLKLVINKEPY